MIGCHSVMERPEPVSRVSPPTTIMPRIISATASSHRPTARFDFQKLGASSMAALIPSPSAAVKTGSNVPPHENPDCRHPDRVLLAALLCPVHHGIGAPC